MTSTALAASSWWAQHGWHVLVLAGPALTMAIGAGVADASARRSATRRVSRTVPHQPLPTVAKLAIAFSLGAAAVHASVGPEHFREAFIYGLFFLCAATAQLGWVVLTLARPRRWLPFGAFAGNLAVVLLWAWTRTIGDFAGPERGQTEQIGAMDIVATTCELAVVICAALWIRQLLTRPASTTGTTAGRCQGSGGAVRERHARRHSHPARLT